MKTNGSIVFHQNLKNVSDECFDEDKAVDVTFKIKITEFI